MLFCFVLAWHAICPRAGERAAGHVPRVGLSGHDGAGAAGVFHRKVRARLRRCAPSPGSTPAAHRPPLNTFRLPPPRYLKGSQYGNVVVWASVFFGQPAAVMLYVQAYLAEQNK